MAAGIFAATPANFAGLLKQTNGKGTSFGFIDQTAQARAPYKDGTLIYPDGSPLPQNGQFAAHPTDVGPIGFPLLPGTNDFGSSGTGSSFGTFTGTSFFSPDQTFFYANLNPSSSPTERAFIFGGQPVSQSFYQATGTPRILTFDLKPDATQNAPIPFTTSNFGANLPSPTVSPLFVVAPASSAFGSFSASDPSGGAGPTLQANLAISGAGSSQSSLLSVSTGSGFTATDTGKVALAGNIRGSFAGPVANGGTPNQVRFSSAFATVPDGNGNSLFG